MADIGISYSSNPARLIQDSGRFLSDNIRQIGQQVQGTILELNTRKDIARMAENLSSLNVQSEAFPIQAAQVFAAHPLAAQDGRGQMVLKALGQAHHDWRQNQELATRFSQQQTLAGLRNEATLGQIAARNTGAIETEQMRQEGRKELAGLRQQQAIELQDMRNEDVLGQIEARAKTKTTSPSSGIPQRRLIIEAQLRNFDSDLRAAEKEHQRLLKEEAAIKEEFDSTSNKDEKAKLEYNRSVKALDAEKVRRQVDELRKKKLQTAEELGALGQQLDSPISSPPDDLGLPPVGADAAAPAQNDVVLVIDPQGRPGKIPASQLEAALQNGFKRR